MQISLEDLERLATLDFKAFDDKFRVNGVDKKKISIDMYAELTEIWKGLNEGYTTAEEYYDKAVEGTYIPVKDGKPKKIML